MKATPAMFADLHMHTTCSDGAIEPLALTEKAIQRGLNVIAITDHDTLEAHRILAKEGLPDSVRIVPGVEFSCTEHGRDVHILGYFLDPHSEELLEYERVFRDDRHRRAQQMVQQLNQLGVAISFDDVMDHARTAPIGRPHVAAALVERGAVTSLSEAFDRYLDTGKPGYAARSPFPIRDAVALIRRTGGISSVAHPHRHFTDKTALATLLATGLDGIEVYHPSHWMSTREHYAQAATFHGLVMTGGSDFHGTRDYDEQNFGSVGITEEQFERLYILSLQRRLHG